MTLQEYSELRPYSQSITSRVCLASDKKSFLTTHYANPRFPVGLEDVCLPNGLKRFRYFDRVLRIWPGLQPISSFFHHCQLILPPTSLYSSLQHLADAIDGPSSYAVLASQSKCPAGLNVHEFMAFQELMSGKNRRWPQILLELGSTNLNFSTEPVVMLINFLALQFGPSSGNDPLGAVHEVFKYKMFCDRLLDLVDQRLHNISSNYRETNSMELIITLSLRSSSLGDASSRSLAARVLEKARSATVKWITVLRSEIQTATDAEISRRLSRYAFWAALLCRRTFTSYIDKHQLLDVQALQDFIESSITLQDNLVSDPNNLPGHLKSALIRDLKMVYSLRHILCTSLQASPESFMASLTSIWPAAESRTFSQFGFLQEPHQYWIIATVDPT